MFPPEFTNLIDEILESPYGLVTQQIITSDSRNIPGTGFHYFFDQTKNNRTFWDNKFRYITFEKKTKKVKGDDIEYYRCYVGGITMGKQTEILNKIRN